MTQMFQPSASINALPALDADLIITQNGQPVYALIEYELYLTLKEAIEEWRSEQRAIAAYEAWREDPSRGQDWEAFKAELVAEGLLDE